MPNTKYFFTDEHAIIYHSLFIPHAYDKGAPQYECTLLLDKEEKDRILAECHRVYDKDSDLIADNEDVIPPFEALHLPIHESAIEKADKPIYASQPYYMTCKSRYPVQVVDGELNSVSDPSLFYNGVLCRLVLTFKLYRMDDNCGISCYLQAVQRTGDGPRLTNGFDAANFFPCVKGSGSSSGSSASSAASGFSPFAKGPSGPAFSPNAGSDDELPF